MAGLLGEIFSAGNVAKRKLTDLLGNPVLAAQQFVGNLNDRARNLNEMTAAAAREGIDYGPASQQLGGLMAEGYNPVGMVSRFAPKSIDDILNKYPDVKIDASLNKNDINLSRIVVPKEMRNQGIGTQVMNDLSEYADSIGKRITLTPSSDFGGSVSKLKTFYKELGFVENKGKNKDFSTRETMYREPKPIEPSAQFEYPQEEAMRLAQQRAALPVEQGGLGLPANNTAMDRAKAMDFDVDLLHGTDKDLTKFEAQRSITKDHGWYGDEGVYLTPDPNTASGYANWKNVGSGPDGKLGQELYGQNVMPLMVRRGNVFDYGDAPPIMDREKAKEFSEIVKRLGYDTVEVPNKYAAPEYSRNYETVVIDPSRIRSRFAAFDPFRKTAATAALMGVAAPDLLAQEVDYTLLPPEKKKELLQSLLGQ